VGCWWLVRSKEQELDLVHCDWGNLLDQNQHSLSSWKAPVQDLVFDPFEAPFLCPTKSELAFAKQRLAARSATGHRRWMNHSGMNCCLRQDAVPGRSSREVMRRRASADAMPGKASVDAWLALPGGRTLLGAGHYVVRTNSLRHPDALLVRIWAFRKPWWGLAARGERAKESGPPLNGFSKFMNRFW